MEPTTKQKLLLERLRLGDRLIVYGNGRTMIHSSDPQLRLTEEVNKQTVASAIRNCWLQPVGGTESEQPVGLTYEAEQLLQRVRCATDETRLTAGVSRWEVLYAQRG